MGVVYEAEHVELGRRVALKTLLPEDVDNEVALSRFFQEARSAASIGHPGIVETFDLGQDDEGVVFIAMEMLWGEELGSRIKAEQPLDQAFVIRAGCELADAVAAAHARGIVHRDLKPQNVFLASKGRQRDIVKVLDFGLAKLTESDGTRDSITRSGEIFGTPLYMAPEQLRDAKDVDLRTDVYAIGVILYEALAGVPPFTAETFSEIVLKVACDPPAPLTDFRSDLDPALIAIVDRALAKDRDERFRSTDELRDDLEALLPSSDAPRTPRSAPPRPVAVDPQIQTLPGQGAAEDFGEPEPEATPPPAEPSTDEASPPPAASDGTEPPSDRPISDLDLAEINALSPTQSRQPMLPPSGDEPKPRRRRRLVFGGVIVLLVGISIAVISLVMDRGEGDGGRVGPEAASVNPVDPPAPEPVQPETIQLAIEATPRETLLFIDDAAVESTPFRGRFARDGLSHRLRAEAEGFETWGQVVVFDRDHALDIELQPLPRPDGAAGEPSTQDQPTGRRLEPRSTSGPSGASGRERHDRPTKNDRGETPFSEDEDPWED